MFFHYDNLRDGWFKCAVNFQVIFDREKFSLGPGLLACTGKTIEKALWNFTASRRPLKSIRYLWFYLALLNDSNAEIVQIYRKSVLLKFLWCAVNIHLIFDREKFSIGPSLLACTGETIEKALWNFKASRELWKVFDISGSILPYWTIQTLKYYKFKCFIEVLMMPR